MERITHHFFQRIGNFLPLHMKTDGVRLQHSRAVVKINDESRHSVAFRVNEPKNIRVFISCHTNIFPVIVRFLNFSFPEIYFRIDLLK